MKSSPDVTLVGRDSYDLEFLLGRLPHGCLFQVFGGKIPRRVPGCSGREITAVMENKSLRAGFNHQ